MDPAVSARDGETIIRIKWARGLAGFGSAVRHCAVGAGIWRWARTGSWRQRGGFGDRAASVKHPHGLEDQNFDEPFTTDKPVIFAFHGYPATLHKLIFTDRNAASGKSVAPRPRAPGARQGSKRAAIERQFIAVSYEHATFLPAAWIWLSLWSGWAAIFAVSEDGPCASHGKLNR